MFRAMMYTYLLEKIILFYTENRISNEIFNQVVNRLGV